MHAERASRFHGSLSRKGRCEMAVKKESEILIVNRRSGKALQATGLDNGLAVKQADINKSDAQVWTMRKTDEGVKFVNKAAAKVLDVMSGGTENGTWAQTWEDVDGDTQFWTVTGTTYKKIVNRVSGKALDIMDMSDDEGAPAQIWEDVGGENQQWKFVPFAAKTTVTTTAKKTAVKKAPVKKAATKAVKTESTAPAAKTAAKKPSVKKPAVKKTAIKKTAEAQAPVKTESTVKKESKTPAG